MPATLQRILLRLVWFILSPGLRILKQGRRVLPFFFWPGPSALDEPGVLPTYGFFVRRIRFWRNHRQMQGRALLR
jgi:hypothetical protein